MPLLVAEVVKKYFLSVWCETGPDSDSLLVPISEYTQEYNSIVEKINLTLHKEIDRVVRIQNPYWWVCYLLKKEKCPVAQEKTLFHVTGANNISSLVMDNFNWKRVKRTRYGRGVSVSPSPAFANMHYHENIGFMRAVILAKLLVGYSIMGNYGTKIPPSPYDTTVRKTCNVYVIYYDKEFYLEYVAYYRN